MDHFRDIYANHAAAYDRMVDAEDCDHQILPALERIHSIQGSRVVEVGVGTGRVTRLLLEAGAEHIAAFDSADGMLAVARQRLAPHLGSRVTLQRASVDRLPVADATADLFIAGWVFGHQTLWQPDTWRSEIDVALAEASRVTAAGGCQIILETMGTAVTEPGPPSPDLAAYYEHLEGNHGFAQLVVATDYEFDSPEAAAAGCRFFFGDDCAELILARRWARVPEWTGIWHRTV